MVRVISEAQDELVTKTYLDIKLSPILTDLDIKLSPILTDLAVLKWMLGILLAGVLSLVLKVFF